MLAAHTMSTSQTVSVVQWYLKFGNCIRCRLTYSDSLEFLLHELRPARRDQIKYRVGVMWGNPQHPERRGPERDGCSGDRSGGARGERGVNVDVELVENPRSAERMVEEFAMDTSVIRWDGNATRMW